MIRNEKIEGDGSISMESKKEVVVLENVTKRFGNVIAVSNLSLKIRKGQFVSLLGPSGCGKTTTLRMISGFEEPSEGSIYIDGKNMVGVPSYRRPTNMCFQNLALFPHMSVFENIAYSLKLRKINSKVIEEKVRRILFLLDLSGLENRGINEISGGQAQRVALARALISEPTVLLLDEPLGSLDRKLRVHMRVELRKIQRRLGITFLYVTHDQEEALVMSDKIVIVNEGKKIQEGSPIEVYNNPQTKFVADFIGGTNLIEGMVSDNEEVISSGNLRILAYFKQKIAKNRKVFISIRPEKIKIVKGSNKAVPENYFRGKVKEVIFLGSSIRYMVVVGENLLLDVLENVADISKIYAQGDEINLWWKKEDSVIISE